MKLTRMPSSSWHVSVLREFLKTRITVTCSTGEKREVWCMTGSIVTTPFLSLTRQHATPRQSFSIGTRKRPRSATRLLATSLIVSSVTGSSLVPPRSIIVTPVTI